MSKSKNPFVFPVNSGSAFQMARERFEKQLLLKKLQSIETEKEIVRREKAREFKHQQSIIIRNAQQEVNVIHLN